MLIRIQIDKIERSDMPWEWFVYAEGRNGGYIDGKATSRDATYRAVEIACTELEEKQHFHKR